MAVKEQLSTVTAGLGIICSYVGQSVAEPEIEPVQHEGISLIEWGGVLDE